MLKKILVFCSILFAFQSMVLAQNEIVKPLTIGETVTLKSKILKEERTLNIYLPLGFDKA